MNTFHPGFVARDAARQIRIQAAAGCLTGPELNRLLDKVEAGIGHLLEEPAPPRIPDAVSPATGLRAIDGGRP